MYHLSKIFCYNVLFVSICGLLAVATPHAQDAAPQSKATTVADNVTRPYELTEKRELCDIYNPLKQVFWGDTHVHTSFSLDAGVQDTRNTPDDAYRYAKGARVGLQPYRRDGTAIRSAQISTPLDFTVVTDHGEALGMVGVCTTPQYAGYDSIPCKAYRRYPKFGFFLMVRMPVMAAKLAQRYDSLYALRGFFDPKKGLPALCGENEQDCTAASLSRWTDTQTAAERAYDRSSACTFSAFIGYEWTGNTEVNLHRNIVFRNNRVLHLPISYVQAPVVDDLLDRLSKECLERDDGCDLLSIPHNPNLSEGRMFPILESKSLNYSAQDAEFRARLEPIVEVMQHKGDSECWYGSGVEDELCAFEKLPYRSFGGKFFDWMQVPSQPQDGYIRDILYQGMRFKQLIGANPYRLGLIAASDTHLGTPGAVEEWQHQGHGGAGMAWSSRVQDELPDDIEYNPGGLMAVWAEENTRDSLFEAMRRREVYGTSGPRITMRMFAMADTAGPDNLCERPERTRIAYQNGVPMGGTISASKSVRLFVDAIRDPGRGGHGGGMLQRIQIVKGWLGKDGEREERVVDIAGGDNDAGVDLDSCKPFGQGQSRMCAVWEDKDFNPNTESYYYARVIENPSCRWNTYICNARQINCANPSDVPEGFKYCCDANTPKTIQERAWSSPVWHSPTASSNRAQ